MFILSTMLDVRLEFFYRMLYMKTTSNVVLIYIYVYIKIYIYIAYNSITRKRTRQQDITRKKDRL